MHAELQIHISEAHGVATDPHLSNVLNVLSRAASLRPPDGKSRPPNFKALRPQLRTTRALSSRFRASFMRISCSHGLVICNARAASSGIGESPLAGHMKGDETGAGKPKVAEEVIAG